MEKDEESVALCLSPIGSLMEVAQTELCVGVVEILQSFRDKASSRAFKSI